MLFKAVQLADDEMWAFPISQDGYGASGTLIRMAGVPSWAGGTMVYFHCDDCG